MEFALSILFSSIVLSASSKLAWVKAGFKEVLIISTILAVVSLIPLVGYFLSIVLFFYLTTSWLGASGMEALYMWLLNLLLTGLFALFVVTTQPSW